jgi:hypothetical protein
MSKFRGAGGDGVGGWWWRLHILGAICATSECQMHPGGHVRRPPKVFMTAQGVVFKKKLARGTYPLSLKGFHIPTADNSPGACT